MIDDVLGAPELRPLLLGMGWFQDQPGGLNRYFAELLRALERRGTDTRAVVVGPASDAPEAVIVAADAGQALPRRLWRYAGAAGATADLFDAHFALYALLPVLTGRRGRPLVVHFHGPWADESEAVGDGAAARRVKRLVERAVYRRARELVVLSGSFRRILVERYRVDPWRVHVIPPGVDLERFSPGDREAARAQLGVPGDAWVVVAARRLVPRMGLDVLLEAWSGIDEPNRLLLIAGDGPERLTLERLARKLAIESTVRFLGRVSEEDLVARYRAADVSVVPSVALEGFGLVTLEALACGTPVVVTDAGGLPETVAGLDPTLVVPAGDAGALALRLRQPLPSADRCRAHAEGFSWDTTAERHLELYRRAVAPPDRERLRVVYVDHTAKLGGGELALITLLRALGDRIDPHVILAEEGPLVDRLVAAGISVEVLRLADATLGLTRDRVGPATLRSPAGLGAIGYAVRLSRRLRSLRPDLVHTNSLKASLYSGPAGALARVPVVWHLRDRISEDYLPRGAVRLVRAGAKRLPAAVIANSSATLASVSSRRGYVIPSPLSTPIGRAPESNGRFRAGMLGRIAPWKGQHVFVEAFARAFPEGTETAVVIGAPLFGLDEVRYFEELKALAHELGLGGRVEFTGFRDDVAAELARLDALVHASVIPEPFGQVVIEGMAAGLPVVAARAGGPAETIDDGVDGLLYPPGDVEALASALRSLATDPALRRRIGAAGLIRARDFAPDVIAERVLAVYREVLAR